MSTVPAFIQQAYGIANDYRDLLGSLDDAAPEIAEEEDELADIALETAMDEKIEFAPKEAELAPGEVGDEGVPLDEDEEIRGDEPE